MLLLPSSDSRLSSCHIFDSPNVVNSVSNRNPYPQNSACNLQQRSAVQGFTFRPNLTTKHQEKVLQYLFLLWHRQCLMALFEICTFRILSYPSTSSSLISLGLLYVLVPVCCGRAGTTHTPQKANRSTLSIPAITSIIVSSTTSTGTKLLSVYSSALCLPHLHKHHGCAGGWLYWILMMMMMMIIICFVLVVVATKNIIKKKRFPLKKVHQTYWRSGILPIFFFLLK